MIGAVSLNPYVSSYQYAGGHVRARAAAQNMQIQTGQSTSTGAAVGTRAVSSGKSAGVSSVIGARSIASTGQTSGVAGVSAGRAADPESPVQPVDAVSVLQPGNSGSTNYTIPFLRKGMDPAELSVRMRIQYDGAGTSGRSQTGNSQAVSRGASEAVQIDLPGSTQGKENEAVQMDLPGSARGAESEAVQLDLPGSARGADSEAVQLDLPGSTQGTGREAVQLDLPGTSAGEAEQMGLPGTGTGKAAEAGLPGASSETEIQNADSGKDAPEVAGLRTEDAEKTPEETECKTCKERKYQDGSNDPGVSFKTPTHIDPGQSASAVRGHEMEHVVNERARAKNEGRRVISQTVSMQTGICPECGRVYTAGGVTRTTTAAETKQEEQPKDPRWILAASA